MKHKNIRKQLLDSEVIKALQSHDNLEDIKVNPFFYTRLQERLNSANIIERASFYKLIFGNLLAPVVLGLIIILNVITLVISVNKQEQNTVDRQTYIEEMTDDYSQSDSYILSTIDRD